MFYCCECFVICNKDFITSLFEIFLGLYFVGLLLSWLPLYGWDAPVSGGGLFWSHHTCHVPLFCQQSTWIFAFIVTEMGGWLWTRFSQRSTYIHIRTQSYTHAYSHTHTHTYEHTHMHIYTHTYKHTHKYTHIHAHTTMHERTCKCSWMRWVDMQR